MGKILVYIGDILNQINGRGKLTFESSLAISAFLANGNIDHYGIVSRKAVTADYAEFLIDLMQAADSTFSDFKYHDFGTGTTPADEEDAELETPTGEAREVGSQIEGATAKIYVTVAVHSFASAFTITEHGVLNAAAGEKLLDRSVFDGVEMAVGDRMRATYSLTAISGG